MNIIVKNIDSKDQIILQKEIEKETIRIKAGESYTIESVHNVHIGSNDKYFKIYYMRKYQHMGINYLDLYPNYWDIKIER